MPRSTFDSLWPDFDHDDHCPSCGHKIEGLTNTIDIDPPAPGDPSVCLYCQAISVTGDDGNLRLPTPDEALEFSQDPNIQAIIAAMRTLGPPKR